jgi:flagellar basal-body rod protein FlgB
MLREVLYNNTALPMYRNALDAYSARHSAIASNIANAESPGYNARKVNFEERLKREMGRVNEPMTFTNSQHIPAKGDPKSVRHLVVEDNPASSSSGVNEVDIEREMGRLTTNQINYALVARRAAGLFGRISQLSKLP